MNCARVALSKRCISLVGFIALVLWIVIIFFALSGCVTKTVAPRPIKDSTASYSETGQADSGMVCFWTNGAGVTYVIVTPSYRARYNGMIDRFSTNLFLPPIQRDHGLQGFDGTNYMISLDGVSKFNKLNRFRKAQ